jgi:magnesium transporter
VIWLGLAVTIVFAKLLGVVLPIVAKKLKIDAALISAPFITVVADIIGVFAFFTFANVMLNI